MINLPVLPDRIARLPKNDRGFPTPWFAAWMKDGRESDPRIDGAKPDFRVIGSGKIGVAWKEGRCWICGDKMGVHRVYVLGPMCLINRINSEPPSHRECAEFAAKACPFLVNPREKRNTKNLIEDGVIAGIHIDRNPGATCLYETRSAKPFRAGAGYLFKLGDPDRVDWYARGRTATREEVEESIRTGYPILLKEALKDGPDSVAELEKCLAAAQALLPKAA